MCLHVVFLTEFWFIYCPQFSVNEDFGQYPRERASDLAKLSHAGVDAVFEPASLYVGGAERPTCLSPRP